MLAPTTALRREIDHIEKAMKRKLMKPSKLTIMKIMGLTLLIPTAAFADIGSSYTQLNNTNYMPHYRACGLHFSIEGSTLYATAIVNERLAHLNKAEYADCIEQAVCNGTIETLSCAGSECSSSNSIIKLLSDGDIIITRISSGTVFRALKSNSEKHYACLYKE